MKKADEACTGIEQFVQPINSDQIGRTPINSDQIGRTTPNSDQIGRTTPNSDQIGRTIPNSDQIGRTIPNSDQIGSALKFDTGKAPMSLLSRTALEKTAAVLAFGAAKYAEHNWRKGFKHSRLLDASLRHLMAYIDGEDLDPESGLSHLDHLACCVMFLQELTVTHPELDDRYKRT